jgi:hypothetical protein
MMFGWFRKRPTAEQQFAAQALVMARSNGELLAACANDQIRAELCEQWAQRARLDWFQGQKEMARDVILSTSDRYKDMSVEARRVVGYQRWSGTRMAKDLAAKEEMYSRWAAGYRAAAS